MRISRFGPSAPPTTLGNITSRKPRRRFGSQWAAIQERIGLNSGWLPGEQRTALAAPLGLTVRSHLTDNSAASHAGGDARPPPSANSNLSVRRQPSCDHSYFAVKSVDATLLV